MLTIFPQVLLDQAWVQVPSVGSSAAGPAGLGVKGGTIGPSSLDLLPAEYCRYSKWERLNVEL